MIAVTRGVVEGVPFVICTWAPQGEFPHCRDLARILEKDPSNVVLVGLDPVSVSYLRAKCPAPRFFICDISEDKIIKLYPVAISDPQPDAA